MRFTCSRERLLGGLQIVGSVVSGKAMKPVYESVFIRVREDSLELRATDLEVAARMTVIDEQLRMAEPGAMVVPEARLSSILREVTDDTVELSWENNRLAIEGRGSHFLVVGQPEEEFPEIPEFPSEPSIVLPARVFRQMVARSAFATAREKMRYALNGVLVLLEGTKLQMVGTDGRRLAHNVAKVENPGNAKVRVIVPTKGITQIAKMMEEDEETLEVALVGNYLYARTRRSVVIVRLVEGTFPNFEEVIPVNCERKAKLNRQAFASAVRRAALVTNREAQSVKFMFSEGRLALSARAAEVGEANVEMEIEYEGEPAEVAFNPVFVLDGLGIMEAETVAFEFRNPSSPARMMDGQSFTYVVMPISLE
jgi:DNA polymerase-3 subunit beta